MILPRELTAFSFCFSMIMANNCIFEITLYRFPVAEPPETPTHLSMLSDSVMRTPALNELSDDNKEGTGKYKHYC